jgi:hypothetical protein
MLIKTLFCRKFYAQAKKLAGILHADIEIKIAYR